MTPENPDQKKAARAKYRQDNKEHIAAYKAAYNQRNREHVTAQQRDYQQRLRARLKAEQEQRDKAAQRAARHAAANPEATAERKRDWAANNPEKVKQARADYRERNRAEVQQRSDVWRSANPDKIAAYTSNRRRDPSALAEYTRQRRADPAKYAHDLELSRDRRRLIRRLQAHGLPPPQMHKSTAAERRTNGAAAREFFTRTRTALERRNLIDDGPAPTAQELQDAARIRAELRNRAEIQERTNQYIARHGKRIRREIELDSRARQLRGATPLDIDAELLRRVRTFTDRYVPRRPAQPAPARRPAATRSASAAIPTRRNDTDRSR